MAVQNEGRVFNKGKQNRDFDPRLVPPGEYIRMVNGRISRSEGSNVGSLENTLGNEAVSSFVDAEGVVLGSIRDQGNNVLYYFIKGSEEDAIYEFDEENGRGRPLLRDNVGVLNFNVDYLITGVNIIGDQDQRLLLWTDGFNPPRKVNIERAFRTLQGGVNGFTEQEISVEKNPPLYPPVVTSIVVEDVQDADEREELDKEENLKDKFVRFAYRWKYEDNEYSVFSPFSPAAFVPGPFAFDEDTGAITGMENRIKAVDISFATGSREVTEVDLLYKEDGSPTVYVVETFNKADRNWNNDVLLGEIVENIFEEPQATFNLPDRLRTTNPILDVRRGTVANNNLTTDYTIAYGELGQPDTITLAMPLTENEVVIVRYYNNAEPIRFSSNKLYRALPDSQLARVFDNVPIRAKAQEIIQNRIVYGNYVDRYNLEDVLKTYETITLEDGSTRRVLTGTRTEEIVVDLEARLSEPITTENFITGDIGERTLKSDRNYELGIVYLDNLGRQTPVLTSENNTVSIPVDRANKINRLSVNINSKAPEWATAYRFFVKQNRGKHFNIIPLEAQLQPDDNRFIWFRVSEGDQEKVSPGDYLNIKITNAMYAYLTNDNKLEVRVEEIGPQGRNFLEVTPPRAGRITLETGDRAGEVLDPGEIYTAQESGIWMKVKNMATLGQDFTDTNARQGEAIARTNNARGTQFQPIRGAMDYQDSTFYYRGNTATNETIDESAVTFSGTYTPGEVRADGLQAGPSDEGAGPMRVQVEIMDGGQFQYSWWISPSHDQPAVIRQTVLQTVPIGTTPLVNGVSVAFNLPAADYNPGDRFVCTFRRAENFMWRAYNPNDSRNRNPNSTARYSFGARQAKLMLSGAGLFDEGINGRSRFQIGVEDGLGRQNEGNPIALAFRRNEHRTQDVFYPTFEEMMFEEGFWSSGGANTFNGTDREGGGFGIHQMGFWRGVPVTPANTKTLDELIIDYFTFVIGSPIAALINIFAGDLTQKNAWRLQTGSPARIMNPNSADGVAAVDDTPLPLHFFIESGVRNSGRNNKKNDIRMRGRVQFTQGTGADSDMLQTLNLVLETVPEENVSDIYYEIGQTFPCLNGIHFGNEMSHAQRVMQNIGADEAGNETLEVTPISVDLDYFNCYAWSNGVESCVVRDEVTGRALDPGAKASSVVDEYEQRENFSNLIFSAPFNQSTNTNGLNEFSSFDVALGNIIKEMDEQDGSIQHLFSRDTDLTVFQEDKITKVLADKNALFGADGQTNLTSARPILGQIVPYTGEFGISRDPESFAEYGGRLYFTDRQRGAVLRLSQNGLTEISNYGMRDFFREELGETYNTTRKPLAVGSYDDYHDQYVLSLREPLTDPTFDQANLPLNISRQAFLSRTDACRFPEEDLQFIEVYEFYTQDEPAGFQVGDIIYTDENRQSISLGDNDWFVWFDREADIDLVSTSATVDGVQSFRYTNDHLTSPMPGQRVTVSARENAFAGTTDGDYTGTVTSYTRVGNGNGSTISVRWDDGVVQDVDDASNVMEYMFEILIDYKFVINIDNFGIVRAKEDCVGITPPNHDAVRVSTSSYLTPEEACGKGLVARIVYHNGDDATPDVGDSIYDTPYASDEYIAGCYMKGRTQKQDWYQMFDGADFEDYVIRILQGKVVEKRRCAEVMAGRRRVITSENPAQRRTGETDIRLATRVCAMLPTMERWFDGENEYPILGDTIYQNNFTPEAAQAGFYAIENGDYIQVTDLGVVSFIGSCSETICVDDAVRARLLEVQNQERNVWRFLGVNGLTGDLPTVSAVAPRVDGNNDLFFNGNIVSLGEFPEVEYSWYYQIEGDEPTERDLVNNGIRVGINTADFTGEVDEHLLTNVASFAQVWLVFAAAVSRTIITTDVLMSMTGRINDPLPATISSSGPTTQALGDSVTLTATPDATNDPRDTFSSQWTLDGVDIAGATELTLDITFNAAAYGDYDYRQIFRGLELTSDNGPLTFTEYMAPAFTPGTAFSTGGQLTATVSVVPADIMFDPLHDTGVGHTYNWYEISDPTTSLGTGTEITVNTDGTYVLEVTDSNGVVGTGMDTVDVNDAIAIGTALTSNPTGVLPGENVTLTAQATDNDGNITSWSLEKTSGSDTLGVVASATGLSVTTLDISETGVGYGVYELTVNDDRGHTVTTDVTVTNTSDPGTSQLTGRRQTRDTGTAVQSGTVEVNTSTWGPALGTRTATFTQTQTFNIRTDFADRRQEFTQDCTVVTAATGDATQAGCVNPLGGTIASGDSGVTEVITTAVPSTTGAQQSRTRTITVTSSTQTTTEAALGMDVDGDGDTLDSVERTVYTTSPNIGSHPTGNAGYTVTAGGQTNPRATLNITGLNNASVTGGDAQGATDSGAVGSTYIFTTRVTPDAGFRWDNTDTSEQRTFTTGSQTHVNAANTVVDLAIDAIEAIPVAGSLAQTGTTDGSGRSEIQLGSDTFFEVTVSSGQAWRLVVSGNAVLDSRTGVNTDLVTGEEVNLAANTGAQSTGDTGTVTLQIRPAATAAFQTVDSFTYIVTAPAATLTGVTINAPSTSVQDGVEQTFSATVTHSGTGALTYAWTVAGDGFDTSAANQATYSVESDLSISSGLDRYSVSLTVTKAGVSGSVSDTVFVDVTI